VAAQNQAICTNYFQNKILKEETNSKYQLRKQHEETIDHLTSGCSLLVKHEYLITHNKVCVHMRYSICTALSIEMKDKWYRHTPKPVYEQEDVTVFWNQAGHTDRELTANRTHTIIKNKKEKICILTDVTIPTERNVVQKEAEKKLKYKSFS